MRERIVETIETYCRSITNGDKATWLALFAADIRQEDPAGSKPNEGLEQVAAFWDAIAPLQVELWLSAPVVVCGNQAIAPIHGRLGPAQNRMDTGQVYDHFVFDEHGKIVTLRAFHELNLGA